MHNYKKATYYMYHALYDIMDYVNEFGVIRAKQLYKFQNGRFFGTCHTSMIFWLQLISLLIVDSVHFIRRLPRYPLEIRSSHYISERNELILERVAFTKQQH